MSSRRLYAWQVKRLKNSGNGAAIIAAAPKDDLKTQIDLLDNKIKAMFDNLPPWRFVR